MAKVEVKVLKRPFRDMEAGGKLRRPNEAFKTSKKAAKALIAAGLVEETMEDTNAAPEDLETK